MGCFPQEVITPLDITVNNCLILLLLFFFLELPPNFSWNLLEKIPLDKKGVCLKCLTQLRKGKQSMFYTINLDSL